MRGAWCRAGERAWAMCATGGAVCAHMQAAECMACAPWARRRSPAAAASTRGAARRIARCRTCRLATKGRPPCVLPTRCVLEAASPCKAARNCTLHACTSHFVAPKFCYLAYGSKFGHLEPARSGRVIWALLSIF